MTLPKPEAGLVIRYSYLWLEEHRQGRDEGIKDRPCAIIVATSDLNDRLQVLVVPVTHRAPDRFAEALEMPAAVKRHLGLDAERSWVVLTESNLFDWPGPDLRSVSQRDSDTFAYGFLPPRFFIGLRDRFLEFEAKAHSMRVLRTE